MSGPLLQFVKAIYPYDAQDQGDIGLPLSESTVVYVAERLDDGWCRGYTKGKEGWFPTSYTQQIQPALDVVQLSRVLCSQEWAVFVTPEDKIYFVNQKNQTSTWSLPQLQTEEPPKPQNITSKSPPVSPLVDNVFTEKTSPGQVTTSPTAKKQTSSQKSATLPRTVTINNLTYSDGGPKQSRLVPTQPSYVDYFWSDKAEKSGFDIILAKHVNGKTVIKDVIDFMKERAAIEDAYAKSLLRLSKSTLGSQEEGSLLHAWNNIKMELGSRANLHSSFANQLASDFNKELFDYKESQKKDRKQHELIISQDRKQIQQLDNSIEKAKQTLASKQRDMENKKSGRKSSIRDIEVLKRKSSYASEELKRAEDFYNEAQRKWIDDMVTACQELEQHEEERSKFMQNMFYKYVDLHVGMHEKSAESLAKVTDAVDRVNPKADREAYIRRNTTGTQRPVDRW